MFRLHNLSLVIWWEAEPKSHPNSFWETYTSCWFQPIWKVWSSNWIISLNRGEKSKKMFELPPPRLYLRKVPEPLEHRNTPCTQKIHIWKRFPSWKKPPSLNSRWVCHTCSLNFRQPAGRLEPGGGVDMMDMKLPWMVLKLVSNHIVLHIQVVPIGWYHTT